MSQGRILCLLSKHVNLRKVFHTNIARLGTVQAAENYPKVGQSRPLDDGQPDKNLLDSEKGQLSSEVASQEKQGNLGRKAGEIPGRGPPPPTPEYCCMSGCNNCVWLEYIEEMKAYYQDGGKRAMEAIDEIPDVTVKTFLKIELCNS